MGTTVLLSRPIQYGDEELTKLVLREPTVEDIIELDDPYVVLVNDKETAIKINNKTILRYAARLAGVPPSVISKITRSEFQELKEVVMNFLGDRPEMSPVSLEPPKRQIEPLK